MLKGFNPNTQHHADNQGCQEEFSDRVRKHALKDQKNSDPYREKQKNIDECVGEIEEFGEGGRMVMLEWIHEQVVQAPRRHE